MSLQDKVVLVTGGARRVGRILALASARIGADVMIHHAHSQGEAEQTAAEIEKMGCKAWILEADLSLPEQASLLIEQAFRIHPVFCLVNNAAIFSPKTLHETTLDDWQEHLSINLTSPFIISQKFAKLMTASAEGRIINILDWRADRPGSDHFAYTISKAALAALTRSLAQSLAPNITVNGLAFGAILPPSDGQSSPRILESVPAGRWARVDEVEQLFQFLLESPLYMTGEIIHLDGGRHLT